MENINKRKIIALSILALLVISFSVYYLIVYKTKISDFDLHASIADAAGVTEDSHFILKTTESLSTQVIEKYLKTSPKFDFKVKKVSSEENTYEIIPEQKLQTDKIYSLEINKGPIASKTFSWAYQIKAPFQLISSIPADKGTDVPTNTGIELYFNRDNIIDPEKDIEIYPKVSGKFEVVENGVRFIPKNPLQEKRIYTIKIKSGLKSKDTKDTLSQDKVIKFQTSRNYSYQEPYADFNRSFSEIKNDTEVLLGISASENTSSVNVSVYKLDSINEFLDSVSKIQGDTPWATYYDNENISYLENKKVFNGSLSLEKKDYYSLIRLPQKLNQGYYVAVIEVNGAKDVSWFQINPNASFSAFAAEKSLIWLKDINSSQNISNIPILFNNKQIGQTNSDGVAVVDTPSELVSDYYSYENTGKKFFIAQIPNAEIAIPIESEYGGNTYLSETDKWWDYVSLNKNIYLPTDTINFWSIIKNRNDELIKEDITVKLTNPYWYSEQNNTVTYAQKNIKVSDFNSVTGDLSYSNLNPGVYQLTFLKGEEVLSQQTITVSAYAKPAYKIILTPDKNSIFTGENVNFKVKAEFFDGTPVSNVKLEYSAYGDFVTNEKGYLNLDMNGESSFIINTQNKNSNYSYWPDYLSVIVKPSESEEAQIETRSSVYVFGPKINNLINQKQNNSTFIFDIKTREVVLKDRTKVTPYWDSEEYLGGPASNISTKVEIYEIEYISEKTGTGYDAINKTTYPTYYWRQEEKLKDTRFLTSDSNGNSQVSIETEKGKTYRVNFVSWDKEGNQIKEDRYVYSNSYTDLFDYEYNSYYYLTNTDNYKKYKIGDPIKFEIKNSQGANPKDSQNNFIFMSINNGKIEYKIQNSAKFNSTFQYKDIPNVTVWSGWFKDGTFFNTYAEDASFDSDEKRLNISVSKDKSTYKPGEKVTLNLKVTDKNNKPVKAEVNLSALDEAVFSISPGEIDVTNDLYKNIYSQVVIRTSNEPPYGGGGAEKGGGGDDGPRSNIKEMAIFKSVQTDNNGSAQVEIKLPDNITSWRLTTQAVTKDLFAGKDISFIPVSLPFFVDSILNKTYLVGDSIDMKVRTFGQEANKGNVKYSVESLTLPFQKIEKTGGNSLQMLLGILTPGIHQITIRANNDSYQDAVTRPLNVLNSYFEKDTSKFYEGQIGTRLENNSKGYTKLFFSSYGKGKFYNELKSMSYQWGARVDQKGSKVIAAKILNDNFAEKNEIPNLESEKYQSQNGGIKLLPYSTEELEISSISAHLFDDGVFNKDSLKGYFYTSMSDEKSDASRIVRSLYGLSAYHEPVLIKLQKIKDDANLNLKDKIFVALALDVLGAKEEARAYYDDKIKNSIEIKPRYAYVKGLKDDETIIVTTLVAALAASLEKPEANQLYAYTEENYPKETLVNFEKLLYVKNAISKLDGENVIFEYSYGDKKDKKSLDDGENFSLTLSPDDLKTFSLSSVKGKLGIVSEYKEEFSPDLIVKDDNLKISRSYEVNGYNTKEFKEGDKVLVRLVPEFNTNALEGSYQIVDYLPSGLRPVDVDWMPYYYGERYREYPVEINDQKVTFVINKGGNYYPIYYYARVVSKGSYKADPVKLQSLKSLESITISNADTVIIK